MKIKKGDTVKVTRGKEAGKTGEVVKVIKKTNKDNIERILVVLKGINLVKRSQKPNPQFGIQGGIIEFEKPIDISNVSLVDSKTNQVIRIGFKTDEKTGKKVRVSKKSGEVI
jgi:large subunit ribosomal protein L24